jgi:hypothetical protein
VYKKQTVHCVVTGVDMVPIAETAAMLDLKLA